MFIATLVIVGGVIGVVELTGDDDKGSTKPSTAAANTTEFNGTYRADYGPGTDLDGKTVSNAPATTSNWEVRSECGPSGCVATAASASGNSLLSNMTYDQIGGKWIAVGLASSHCGGEAPSEIWVVFTVEPQPDGTLVGDSIRASTDSLCAAKRTLKIHTDRRRRSQQGYRSGGVAAARSRRPTACTEVTVRQPLSRTVTSYPGRCSVPTPTVCAPATSA